jgi:DNA-binding transcriptional regulator GbsR (MarR family)
VGQIYALLYLSEKPLNAEEISGALGFSRSNVSMGLKELDAWRLVRLRHLPGDRRDHYVAPDDVWRSSGRWSRSVASAKSSRR